MSFSFTKNIQFTRLVKTEGRLKEFNFRKTGKGTDEKFSVDTVDDRGNRIVFYMTREEDHWRIGSALLPLWITGVEDELDKNIQEELSSGL
jgi:hypothetical protein